MVTENGDSIEVKNGLGNVVTWRIDHSNGSKCWVRFTLDELAELYVQSVTCKKLKQRSVKQETSDA